MRRIVALVAFLAVSLGVAIGGTRTDAAPTTASPPLVAQRLAADVVSYCHRTTSILDPYDLHTEAAASIVGERHDRHGGPVFPAVDSDGRWGDIIPPFDYDNGSKHFPGLNWPGGANILDAGCAVHATLASPPIQARSTVTSPNIVVNVSCRQTMNLDVTFNEEPPSPWTLIVFIDGVQQFVLPDNDSDLRGFHPKIPAEQLPQVSYAYSVNATNAGQTFTAIAAGNVVCQTPPPTTTAPSTTARPTTTTTKPSTTTTTSTTTTSTTTTTKPSTTTTSTTTTIKPTTTTAKPPSPTSPPTTSTGATSTLPTTTAPAPTTTTIAGASSSTTTTSIPPPTGTSPPTTAPTPLDPPPVDALPPGEVLSDPPPPILAFVVVPGNRVVVIGVLSPEQIRALFHELSERKLAHTGSDTADLVLVASLTLLSGGALVGLARRPRRRTA